MKFEEFQKMHETEETDWWYRSRTCIVADTLKKIYGDKKDLKILDLATAVGNNFKNFDNYGKMYGIDISWESIKYCKERGIDSIIRGDAMRLPFKDNVFDLVIALDAFEHFKDDRKALEEVNRVIKEKGCLIVTVPALMLLWSPHDEAFHHHRRYAKTELAGKMEASGFAIERITYWTFLLMPSVYLFRKVRKLCRDGEPVSDFYTVLPSLLGRLFGSVQTLERGIIEGGISLPVGVSLFCVAKKTGKYRL